MNHKTQKALRAVAYWGLPFPLQSFIGSFLSLSELACFHACLLRHSPQGPDGDRWLPGSSQTRSRDKGFYG